MEPASIGMGISPVALTYGNMISSRVNRDNRVRQLVASGSSHFLIRVLENTVEVYSHRFLNHVIPSAL